MPWVSGLKVTISSPVQSLMDSLLLCWVNHGSVNFAKTLKVTYNNGKKLLRLWDTHAPPTSEKALSDEFEALFGSLHTLDLRDVSAPWSSAMYQGSSSFDRVPHPDWYPTQSQIAGVLTASPRLRSLTLTHLQIRQEPGFISSPVTLNGLQVLSIESFTPGGMCLVLPLITGGSDSLC
jgi:hypothetical protein